MLKFLDAVRDSDEWERLVIKDPHFSPAYYRAFGGGQLAILEYGDYRIVQPFMHQGDGWVGNAYNFGGPIGDFNLAHKFSLEFDEWKNGYNLNERCTLTPFAATVTMSRHLSHRDVVLVDLTAIKIRQTTRHSIDKAIKNQANMVMVDDPQNIHLFEDMYHLSMNKKVAKKHWHYDAGTFAKVSYGLGPKRSALFLTTIGGIVESGCVCIFDEKVCYYHWAATYGVKKDSGANHFQVWSVINWAKEQGLSYVHLGGGVSPDNSNDGLFKFKAGFSPITRKVFSYETHTGG